MLTLTTLFVFFITLFAYAIWYVKKSRRYFQDAGIPYLKPHWFFGNMKAAMLMKTPFIVEFAKLYHELKPYRFAGFYNLFQPGIMIRDPDLIKRILIKDFSYFQNHGLPVPKEEQPWGNNLFTLEGEEWKNLRIKLIGTFSSGKMKMMFPLVKKCAEDIKPTLMEYVSSPDGFEVKDLAARYTTDVIGSCAFGIDTGSLKNPNSEFRLMGKKILEFRWQNLIRFIVPKIPFWCVKLFKLETFSREVTEYFRKSVENMVKYREENNITRGDFLDILIAMKNQTDMEKLKDHQENSELIKFMDQIGEKCNKSNVEMNIEAMAAQCFLFFIGGFEGASASLSFLLLELAQNHDIQNRIRDEITSTIENNGGEVTYNLIKKMSYLNMAVKETLRKYGLNGAILLRKCNENYKIPESDVIIKKGMPVLIPMLGIQTDEKYFEKPDEFYPEHFTPEAISRRPHFSYLPFGEGPRVCIAERFANMQMLMAAIYMIKDFSFEVSSKTTLPLQFEASSVSVLPVKGGIWLKCKPVQNCSSSH